MVAQVRSQTPTALPAGLTQDAPFQPLSQSGYGDPAFYHEFFDDFDNSVSITGTYTKSATGGTVTNTAIDGGNANFAIPATANDYASLQLPAASFQLPQGTTYPTGTLGKKLFYGARINGISTLASYSAILGLVDTTTTPFSAITDGVYFSLATAGINLVTVASSSSTTWTIPTSAYSSWWAASTQIDLAFYIDWYQNIHVYVAQQLFGYIPQSGSGSIGANPPGISVLPELGACLTIIGPSYQPMSGATGLTGPWTVSTAVLNLTAAIETTATTAVNMNLDFHLAQKER